MINNNKSPLYDLHLNFEKALEEKSYLEFDQNKLHLKPTKKDRLSDIFKKVQDYIQVIEKNSKVEDLDEQIRDLKNLQKDGTQYAELYQKKTRQWSRVFLKNLAHYTPSYFKRFLPACFSNKVSEAETETVKAINDYQDFLNGLLQSKVNKKNELDDSTIFIPLDKREDKPDHLDIYSVESIEELPLQALSYEQIKDEWNKVHKEPEKCILFDVNSRLGVLQLADQNNLKIKSLANFDGQLFIKPQSEEQAIRVLNALIEELKKPGLNFHPCQIKVKFGPAVNLTPSILDKLLDLASAPIKSIRIEGLTQLNFKIFSDFEKNDQFIQGLEKFCFADLEEINLSQAHIKTLPLILQKMPNVKSLRLDETTITDRDLKNWIQAGYLSHLQSLHLDQCSSLTTDCLHALTTLTHLTELSLPDLKQGRLNIDKLPKLDNPFRIKLFYTSCSLLREKVNQLYTGPVAWASAFQIPLARLHALNIFSSKQTILDPKTVAYWLYQGDYENLALQPTIKTIRADSNEHINSSNLVNFTKKFPNVTNVSLYNCPNITAEDIFTLLIKCPVIRQLDLSHCPQINYDILFENSLDIFNKLDLLTLSDIDPTQENVSYFIKNMKDRIRIKQQTITITNEQLIDENSLEKILMQQPLNQIRHIDFTGCTNLTNEHLSLLLDRLNTDMFITTSDGISVDNPGRLDLATLNLIGCIQITENAFEQQSLNGKMDAKILENLQCIIIDKTKSEGILKDLYPTIIFQEVKAPLTIKINPDAQLQACDDYFKEKGNSSTTQNLRKLGQDFIHHRLAVDLFFSACEDRVKAKAVIKQPISINEKEFYDFDLSVLTHRDILMSESSFFKDQFRPGEKLFNSAGLNLDYDDPKIPELMLALLLGKKQIEDLSLDTLKKLIEPIGSSNFNTLPLYYNKLLDRIHGKFDIQHAEEMLQLAIELKDQVGLQEYKLTLVNYLDNYNDNLLHFSREFTAIASVARIYYPPNSDIINKIDEMEANLTQIMIIQAQN